MLTKYEVLELLARTVTERVVETGHVTCRVPIYADGAPTGEMKNVPGTWTVFEYTGHLDGQVMRLRAECEQPEGFPDLNEYKKRACRNMIARKTLELSGLESRS